MNSISTTVMPEYHNYDVSLNLFFFYPASQGHQGLCQVCVHMANDITKTTQI